MHTKKPYGLAVRAIIVDPLNRCLLIRRSPTSRHFAGQWEWPGGKVDQGEDFAHAVVREAREETGLDVEITGFAGAASFELAQVNVVVVCMECSSLTTVVHLSEEHDKFAWVPASEVVNWNLTIGLKEIATAYAAAPHKKEPDYE